MVMVDALGPSVVVVVSRVVVVIIVVKEVVMGLVIIVLLVEMGLWSRKKRENRQFKFKNQQISLHFLEKCVKRKTDYLPVHTRAKIMLTAHFIMQLYAARQSKCWIHFLAPKND